MAEKEYIEREVKKITCKDCVGDKFCSTYEKYDESLLKDISGECDVSKLCAYFTPAADAVEVVRCKDCIYSKEYNYLKPEGQCMCERKIVRRGIYPHPVMLIVSKDGFCSHGERKEATP